MTWLYVYKCIHGKWLVLSSRCCSRGCNASSENSMRKTLYSGRSIIFYVCYILHDIPQRRLAPLNFHLCKYFILVLKTVLWFCEVTNPVIFCIILMSVEQSIRNLWPIKLNFNWRVSLSDIPHIYYIFTMHPFEKTNFILQML